LVSLSWQFKQDTPSSYFLDFLSDIDTEKVRFVFRDFPFNYPALLGSMVLQCIPQDVRYDYMNALFQLQSDWVVKENEKSANELYKIMQSGGMTKNEFDNCIQDRELENIKQGEYDVSQGTVS
jgi:protein-disulfide isomerase